MVDLLFKLLPVLLAQLLFFCSYVFTFFQLLILELNFCDSGEAWEIKVFLQKRGRWKTGQGGGGVGEALLVRSPSPGQLQEQ